MIIQYPISINYMAHWQLYQALREVVQNAMDSGQYYVENNFNHVVVRNKLAEPIAKKELLWLGESNKGPNAIGKFGEGLKLALLVLTRLKIPHGFRCPGYVISGLEQDGQFCISLAETDNTDLQAEFYVESSEAAELISSMLLSSRKYKLLGEYNRVQVIDRPGEVYVNGLLITNGTGTKFGYNFPPNVLNLDRDRQTVSSFELSYETSRVLVKNMDYAELAKLMYEGAKDVEYAESFANDRLARACFEYAASIYGKEVLIARTAEEARVWQLFNPTKHVVHVNGGFGRLGSSYSSNAKGTTLSMPKEKPAEVLASFFERNKKHVRAKALRELKLIVQASTRWTKS